MGSTGHGRYRTESLNSDTFGIERAVAFKGKVPANSNLKPVSSNSITLKVPINKDNNVLFQFRLSKNSKEMTIIGFRDGRPEVKSKVAVDSGQPSLDKVIATGSKSQRQEAIKMKQLMNESSTMSEDQLGMIANALLRKKIMRRS